MIKKFILLVKSRPFGVLAWKVKASLTNQKIPDHEKWLAYTNDKSGIEIGGPSGIFSAKNYLPIYSNLKSLDGVNYSTDTIWEGRLEEGNNYLFDGRTGFQFIAEGTNLSCIEMKNMIFC